MASTSANSDETTRATGTATSGTTAKPDGGPSKLGRFRRRDKAGKADEAAATTSEESSTPQGKAKATTSAAAGAEKSGKAGKADKPRKDRPVLSGAARLARVITVLGLIAAILAVVLVVQLVKGPGDAAARAAQEDRKEAARSQAEVAVARLFSFDYKTLDADFAAQLAQTTGPYTAEVEKVTGPAVRPVATKEHVIVQAVSVASAVVDDPGPDVQVIVFLNQAVTLDLLPAPRLDRNRVLASMRLVNGQWKVAGIKAL
jgi:Mce-associated membrane protein